MKLNGLNIRKGLELKEEVKVSDIFKESTEEEGNKKAVEIYNLGWDEFIKKYPNENVESIFGKDDAILYISPKVSHQINDNLIAYIYDSYIVFIDDDKKIKSDKHVEIEFVNTEMLDFQMFCRNVMDAQAFSGNYEMPDIKYSFIGTGNFSMSEYAEVHNLVIYSRMHMLDFFIFYKNVLSSIGYFLSGLFEDDIKQQKEYLEKRQYNSLLKECKKQRVNVVKRMEELGGDFYGEE
jgi:hypothetical protein